MDEALHLLDVGLVERVRLSAVVVGAVIIHDANTDSLRVTRVVWRRGDAEREVQIDVVARGIHTLLPHRVTRPDVAIGPVEGEPGGRDKQPSRQPLVYDAC